MLPARSSVTLTTTAALPSLTLTSATTPEPSSFLIASAVPRSSLAGTPSSVRAANLISPTCLKPLPEPPPPPTAILRRSSAASRSSRRRSSTSASSRAGSSAGATLRLCAKLSSRSCSRRASSKASSPVTASIAAHAGGDGALADDPEQRDVAGAADMGAAAQLDRVGPAVLALAHRDHAHLVAVLLAEQRHGAGADRLVAAP